MSPLLLVNEEEECFTCGEDPSHDQYPIGECPESKRPCGHHCNCLWDQDCCHWCGGEHVETQDGDVVFVGGEEITKYDRVWDRYEWVVHDGCPNGPAGQRTYHHRNFHGSPEREGFIQVGDLI